jgi:gamma-glutamyl-gamma-aminobutyrate hydrolase PuuD/uncharacterized protein YjbI with pentapeptide repeats
MSFDVEMSGQPQFFMRYLLHSDTKEISSAFNMLSTTDQKILIGVTKNLSKPKKKTISLDPAEKKVMQKYLLRLHEVKSHTIKLKLVFVIRAVLSKIFPSRKVNSDIFLTTIHKKPLTQKALRGVLKELQAFRAKDPDKPVNFAKFLHDRGFSKNLSNLNFSIENLTVAQVPGIGITPKHSTDLFKKVIMTDLTFTNCDFSFLKLSHAQINNCTFDRCNLKNAIFAHAKLQDVKFNRSQLQLASFDNAKLQKTEFQKCPLDYVSFMESHISHTTIDTCTLQGTNFLAASVVETIIKDSDLKDCLFFETKDLFQIEECTENTLSGPIIALAWDTEKPGYTAAKTVDALIEQGAIPIRFNYNPEDVDPKLLNPEVDIQLKKIDRIRGREPDAIPLELIKRARESEELIPEIKKLYARAELILSHTDALLLPGGADIQPELYGQLKGPKTEVEKDFRRSVLEISLIHQAREKGIPFMGVCRGSQMGNIFYGGTLTQHVEGQAKVIQQLKPTKAQAGIGIIRSVAQSKLAGLSIHHQASDKIAKGLELVLEHEGVAKAIEGEQGAPMLMLQFHPEFKSERTTLIAKVVSYRLSQANIDILDAFIGSAQTVRNKKAVHQEITALDLVAQKARLRKISLERE